MAGIMRICAGLVGPKSENVDFSLVFQAFLKGQWSHETSREELQRSEPEHFFCRKNGQKGSSKRSI